MCCIALAVGAAALYGLHKLVNAAANIWRSKDKQQ